MDAPLYRIKAIKIIIAIFFILLFQCKNKDHSLNYVHILIAASLSDQSNVELKLNNRTLHSDKWAHTTVKYLDQKYIIDSRVLHFNYIVGKNDTAFTLNDVNKDIFISLNYSKWQKKFIITKLDSVSFWKYGAGSNDEVLLK